MAAIKKIVVKLDLLHCDMQKKKAIKTVSTLCGIDEIVVDTKDGKMTAVGTVDPVDVVHKLRKRFCSVRMVSVGPAKVKVEEKVPADAPAKEEKNKDTNTLVPVYVPWYPPPHHPHPCYLVHTEEHPHACVIS